MEEKRLNQLAIGQSASIVSMQLPTSLRRRLFDLGMVKGTQIKALHRSPAGDPVAYSVRGSVIALRGRDTARIWVQITDCTE